MMKDRQPILQETNEGSLLLRLGNPYFAARYIEITTLLSTLLEDRILHKQNLNGTNIDCSTGSGIGLLSLRKFSEADLHGVDDGFLFFDYLNSYSGHFRIPTERLINAAHASFHRDDDGKFLQTLKPNSVQLISCFYIDSERWKMLDNILDAAGNVLTPGGQMIVTTDAMVRDPIPSVPWGTGSMVYEGENGNDGISLYLHVPEWMTMNYQNIITFADWFLEDEIHYSRGTVLGNIRDRAVAVYTKQ